MTRLVPTSFISSPHPLVYVEKDKVITLNEAEKLLLSSTRRKTPRRQNRPQIIVWTQHTNQLEVCFDYQDVANQLGVSLGWVRLLISGKSKPLKQAIIIPLPNTKLVGWKREDLLAVLENPSGYRRPSM
jgi:hypothetical protein